MFGKAISKDPSYARAYARLANWHAYHVYSPLVSFEKTQRTVRQLTRQALDCASHDTVDLSFMASAHLLIGDHDLARQYTNRARQRNPNHFIIMMHAAMNFAWQGETDKSLIWLKRFLQVAPTIYGSSAEIAFEVYYMAERYNDAITAAATFRTDGEFVVELAAAYAQAGRVDEAVALRRQFEENMPQGHSFETHKEAILRTCARQRERNLWCEGYRKAGFRC